MDKTIHQIKLVAKTLPKGMLQSSKETQLQKQIGHVVVNLTDLNFTDNEIELLNKGLSFSPSPKTHSVPQLWLDFKRYE